MKDLYKIFLFIGLLVCSHLGKAQFITAGLVEYERRTNQHSLMDDQSMWDEMFRSHYPKFVNFYFDLRFDSTSSLYKTGKDPDSRMINYGLNNISNYVYKNLQTQTFINQKTAFGSDFLISDSIEHLQWKITSELRNIAGFECRKAITTIFDSVVVIAFYTDEIVPSTGPEMFGGLPGLILGLAIPRMHTTWYATKLEVTGLKPGEIQPPKRGKKMTEDQFETQIMDLIKDDKWLSKYSWLLLL